MDGEIVPKNRRSGNEYAYWGDLSATLKTAASLGIWERPWMGVEFPYPRYAEIGRIEAERFNPSKWRPDYPNAAFDRMLGEDAFWAALILERFTDEMIRAIVRAAEYSNREAEDYLVRTLLERRDKVLDHYLGVVNPLAYFKLDGSRVVFRNLGSERGLADDCAYQYQWFELHNGSQLLTPLDVKRFTGLMRIPVPDSPAEYLVVRIKTLSNQRPDWRRYTVVCIRQGSGSIVGIERELGQPELDRVLIGSDVLAR
jgi:hypothetical protein